MFYRSHTFWTFVIASLVVSLAGCDTTLPEERAPVVQELVGVQAPIVDSLVVVNTGGGVIYDGG